MNDLAPGEWGRVYAAADLLVANDDVRPPDLVDVLTDGQRQMGFAEAVEAVEGAFADGPLEESETGAVTCSAPPIAEEDRQAYPEAIKDRGYWVTWALDAVGRKRPRAPWQNGHAYPAEWRNSLDEEDDPTTSYDQAREFADLNAQTIRGGFGTPEDDPDPGNLDVGIILPQDRPEREERITLVDWDDVRNPEVGEVHPVAAAYLEYYPGFAEISQSGEGIHQFVFGGLDVHNRKKFIEAVAETPFVGTDVPQVELYDGGRHTAMTGRHVAGTAEDVHDGQDMIDDLVEKYGGGTRTTLTAEAGDIPEEKTGEFVGVDLDERPDDRPKCYHAVLKAREHSDELDHISNWELIGYAALLGREHGYSREEILVDLKEHGTPQYGYDPNREPDEIRRVADQYDEEGLYPPNASTLADRGLLPNVGACGCSLHNDEEAEAKPVSALPVRQLAALDENERRRAAEKRGLHIPKTEEVRDRVADAVTGAMRDGRTEVVEAPTGAGKSYFTATTDWSALGDVTGDQPVVLLADTREHRKQNADKSQEGGVTYRQLRGRTEACPVAAGEHDPRAVAEADEDLQTVTVNGEPASAWIDHMTEQKGIPFSVAHKYAEKFNDQGKELPCHADGTECLAIAQWEGLPRDEDGEPSADVIHATHQFAMVPSLRMSTNLVFDELPDFTVDIGEHGLSHDRIHRMVATFLEDADAVATTWEAFVGLAKAAADTDAGREADQLERTIQRHSPNVEWYFDEPDAHTLAPALARAIWFALRGEADRNGRRKATVPHEPPRLDKNANDNDGWNREWVTVTLDDQNRVRKLWESPDLSQARSVVGLDARPAMPRWTLNVDPSIEKNRVLDAQERALWRFFEQQKTVVQVGDATRPFTSGEYFDEAGTRTILGHLVDEHDDPAVITAGSVEHQHREILEELGVDDPKTMHYGEEKSREDMADEEALLVNGVIDPGDDMVLDLLAALEADAEPETTENDDGEEVRAHGRGFVGDDAETAAAILESVRANHVAQAVGRAGRNPGSGERATVYVRTDVAPPDLVDFKVPGVEWLFGDKQRAIVHELRSNPGVTARELAEITDATKEHVRSTLEKLNDRDLLRVRKGVGEYGADEHRLVEEPGELGVADLGTTNSAVWSTCTLELAIDSVHLDDPASSTSSDAIADPARVTLDQFGVEPPG